MCTIHDYDPARGVNLYHLRNAVAGETVRIMRRPPGTDSWTTDYTGQIGVLCDAPTWNVGQEAGGIVRFDDGIVLWMPDAHLRKVGEPISAPATHATLRLNDRVNTDRGYGTVTNSHHYGSAVTVQLDDGFDAMLVSTHLVYLLASPVVKLPDTTPCVPDDVDDDEDLDEEEDDEEEEEEPEECDECGNEIDDCECCSICDRRTTRCDCCMECERRSHNCTCDYCSDCDEAPCACSSKNGKRASYHSVDRTVSTHKALNATQSPVFGIEMEYVFRDDDDLDSFIEEVVTRYTINSADGQLIVEMDGSLPDDTGVELVAPPFSLMALREDDSLWRNVIVAASDYEHEGHQNAGMHINMDYTRNFGGNIRAVQAFVFFFNRMSTLSIHIAGRTNGHYAPLNPGIDWYTAGVITHDSSTKFRAVAVHGARIEVRAMKSATDIDVFFTRIEYCDALADFANTFVLPFASLPRRELLTNAIVPQNNWPDSTSASSWTEQFIDFALSSGQWPTLATVLEQYREQHGGAVRATPAPSLPRLASVHPLGSPGPQAQATGHYDHAPAMDMNDAVDMLAACGLPVYTIQSA